MVFSVGPAGTGKTYLAVAMAVHMLNARRVRRIILTRPAVEAGEKLGFLPGDLAEKVNPYLRPLHDALLDMLGPQKMASLQETGIIEVAPLAFMRGRTLNDAFIILDEAQNTTREQMKMFLTRLGFGSRAAITGDITQIDLPAQGEDSASRSGLVHALHVLKGVKGVAFRHFTSADVVRHPLVGRIVQPMMTTRNSPLRINELSRITRTLFRQHHHGVGLFILIATLFVLSFLAGLQPPMQFRVFMAGEVADSDVVAHRT
mgnify:CR=1 FL=1